MVWKLRGTAAQCANFGLHFKGLAGALRDLCVDRARHFSDSPEQAEALTPKALPKSARASGILTAIHRIIGKRSCRALLRDRCSGAEVPRVGSQTPSCLPALCRED